MCGIVGYWCPKDEFRPHILKEMCDSLVHRGPDSEGQWHERERNLALGHRRLSILDLSSAGNQPMTSSCGRYVIVYNGEIYNHLELRKKLQGVASFRGHSDTETLLACIQEWGLFKSLKECVGMFALALWDKKENSLKLARDRFGEKPLYYTLQNENFFFSSELNALKKHPRFKPEVDRNILALYLRHNYVPGPYSIYKDCYKLDPGQMLTLREGKLEKQTYWSVNQSIEQAKACPFTGSFEEASHALESLLSNSISNQMLSDVSLGAFLSGGIDSSTIVALMQNLSSRPIKTFTIGFGSSEFNEATHAKAVAKHLGTDHHELYISGNDAQSVIPKLSKIYSEPFADSSQIPTFLVSQMAREKVSVSLSGDGGDELFGGYNRYFIASGLWKKLQTLPPVVRKTAARVMLSLSPDSWEKLYHLFKGGVPKSYRMNNPGDKVHKLARVMNLQNEKSFYQHLVSTITDPCGFVLNSQEPATLLSEGLRGETDLDFVQWMMAMDTQTYMVDDILVKVDRAAMANSLETRVPLLDHRLFEFAWTLPQEYKIRHSKGKAILRDVLYRHVPRELIERPKAGFAVPLGDWLRGSLKDWAAELLDSNRLKEEGFFDPQRVEVLWEEHQSGKRNMQHELWGILMFQDWLKTH